MFHPEMFNNFAHNRVDIVRSWLLLPQDQVPLLLVAWTLIHEVYFYLIISFVLFFGFRNRLLISLIWFFLVAILFECFGATNFGENRLLQLMVSPFSMTFLLGFFIGLHHRIFSNLSMVVSVCLLVGGIVGYVIGFSGFHLIGSLRSYPDNNLMVRFVWVGIPSALILAGFLTFEGRIPRQFFPLVEMGNASYALYLLHMPIVDACYRLAAKTVKAASGPWMACVVELLTVALCISAALIFHHKFEKPAVRFVTKFLEKKLLPACVDSR